MPKEGDTGTLPDGTPVIFLGGRVRKMNAAGMAELGDGFARNRQGQIYRQGPQGGFSRVSGPTDSDVQTQTSKASQINNAMQLLDAFDKGVRKVKTVGPFGWGVNGNELAELEGLANQLKLALKEQPYNLGVLNGPDLDILNSIVSDPTKLKDAAFRKSITPRLRNIAMQLGNSYRSTAQAYQGAGGLPETTLPRLWQAPDSQYTKDEWRYDGTVPKVKNMFAPRGAKAPQGKSYKAKNGLTVYED